jgi:hypothetical protein
MKTAEEFNHKAHIGHIVGARFIAPSDGRSEARRLFNRKGRKEIPKNGEG